MKLYTKLSLAIILCAGCAQAQTNFRSVATGNWSAVSTWQVETPDGSNNWITPSSAPDYSTSILITLKSPYTVTVDADVTIDQTTVDPGATLTVADGIILTLNNGPGSGSDLFISAGATLDMLGESYVGESATGPIITISGNLRLGSLNSTGAIRRDVPTLVGNMRITVANRNHSNGSQIIYAGTAPQFMANGHSNSAGRDVVINNSNGVTTYTPSATINIGGSLYLTSGDLTVSEINMTITGNVVTQGSNLIFQAGTSSKTLTVTGNINLNSGQIQIISGTNNSIDTSLAFAGDVTGTDYITFSGENCRVSITGTGGNLSRDFPISSPTTLEVLNITRPGGTIIIPQDLTLGNGTLGGGVNITSGSLDMNAELTVTYDADLTGGNLYFEGHTIELQRTVTSSSAGFFSCDASSTMIISGGNQTRTLYFSSTANTLGTFIMNKTGTSTVILNSTLNISGSLYLTNGEFSNLSSWLTMASGAIIIRTGQADFFTGSVAPAGGPYNIIFNNYTNGVDGTSTTTTSLSTGVETQGSVQNVTNNLSGTLTHSTSLAVQGTYTLNSGIAANASGLVSFSSGGNLIRNGTATFTGVAPTGGPYNLTYNGTSYSTGVEATGSINNATNNLSGTLTHSTSLAVQGTYTLNSGIAANASGLVSFSSGGNLIRNGTATFTGVVPAGGPYNLTYNGTSYSTGVEATGSINNATNNLSGTLTHSTSLAVQGTYTLNSGVASNASGLVSFSSGGTLTRNGTATFTGVVPAGGPYNLIYNGTSYSTGVEMNGSVSDLTNNLSGTLTLSNALVIAGVLYNTSGTFLCNAFSISAASLGNAGTFNAPSSTITLTGNFTDNATFNHNNGEIIFNGTSALPGSSTTNFYRVTINNSSSLTSASGTMNIAENFIDNGTFNHNSGTINFNGTSALTGSSTTGFNNLSIATGNTLTSSSSTIGIAGNFTNDGTFAHNSGTVDFNGTTTITGTQVFNNVTISGILNGPSLLNLIGNFVNNSGSLLASTGTVRFSGAGAQTIGGSQTNFYNVDITNTGGSVTVLSAQNLFGSLTLGSTSTFQAGNNLLTLNSTSDTQSANIGVIASGATFNGTIRVQRFMSAQGAVNRYVSSPVTGATLGDLASNFPLSNGAAQYYNEPTAGNSNKGYKVIGQANTLISGKGYLIMPGTTVANTNITWDVSGPLTVGSNQKDIKLPLSYTVTSGGINNDGWNLVGNPYPSPIVWSNDPSQWSNASVGGVFPPSIDPVIYVSDVDAPANIVYYPYDVTDGAIIAPGQAFWIKKNGTGPVYIHEAAKTSASGTFYRKPNFEKNAAVVSLTFGDDVDKAFFRINPEASLAYDKGIDFFKLEGDLMSIGIASSEMMNLVRSEINKIGEEEVYLPIKAIRAGEYSISFEQKGEWDEFEKLFLVDKQNGNVHPVTSGAYTFRSGGNETMRDRFYLTSNPEKTLGQDILVSVFPNPTVDKINIKVSSSMSTSVVLMDMKGAKLMDGKLEASGEGVQAATLDVKDLMHGIYMLRTMVNGKMVVKKVVKQ